MEATLERRWQVCVKPIACTEQTVIIEQFQDGTGRKFSCRQAHTCSYEAGALRLTLPNNITFECAAERETGELINPTAYGVRKTVRATVAEVAAS